MDKEAKRAYNRAYRARLDVKARARQQRMAVYWGNRERAIALKGGRCQDCGDANPVHLQFDHLYGKERTVGTYMSRQWGPALEAELKKCDLVCANCHCDRTFARRDRV